MIAVLLLSVLPFDGVPQCVDVVEINHVCDDTRVRLEQVVWWEWCRQCNRFEVVDWRLLEKSGWPRLERAGWVSDFTDDGQRRIVIARTRRETWTVCDVELDDRRYLSVDKRRGIRRQQ